MEGEVERWLGMCENDRGVDVTEFELETKCSDDSWQEKASRYGRDKYLENGILMSSDSVSLFVH